MQSESLGELIASPVLNTSSCTSFAVIEIMPLFDGNNTSKTLDRKRHNAKLYQAQFLYSVQ